MTLLRKESEYEKLCLLWYSVVVRAQRNICPGAYHRVITPAVQLQTCEAQSHYVGGHVCCH